MNRKNLERLGCYLANLSPSYVKKHFDMRHFFEHNKSSESPADAVETVKTHFCGTVACAVGHIPMALPEIDFSHYYWGSSWWRVSADILGISSIDREGLWEFLFSMLWGTSHWAETEYDKTAYAAADRIAYVLFEVKEPDFVSHTDMGKAYGAAKRAGWVKRQKMTRKVMQDA